MNKSGNNTKIGKNARTMGRPVGSLNRVTQKKLPPAKTAVYSLLRANGIPANLAKSALDIPSKVNVSTGTIDQQREKALKALDLTLYSQFSTLKDIRDDTTISCQSDRIHAVKTINSMIPGYTAPSEIKVNSSAIMVEFKDLSSNDLANLADILGVKASVPYQCTDTVCESQVIDCVDVNE